MPRSLVLGNGSLLTGFDRFGQLRDFYYEYVDLENHMGEDSINKIGLYTDDQISWTDSGEWNIAIDYKHETLAGSSVLVNERLGIEMVIEDVVYNEQNILFRKFVVKNKLDRERTIKTFVNHQFRMYGIPKKDTVYFDPSDNTIVHYKGRRVVIIGAKMGSESFSSYSVGLSNIEGKAGTWKDAEDGELSGNPIEHGTVDSTIGFEQAVPEGGSYSFFVWVVIAKTFQDAKNIHRQIERKSPERYFETTEDYWYAWVNKSDIAFGTLDKRIVELFKKSLLIIRTHADNTGAIIASGDYDLLRYGRDNYTYVWPRDASFITIALNKAGYFEVARKFFEFANIVITDEGYFFHRYRCDKSWGSSWHPWVVDGKRQLPIQEDETALVLCSLWDYYERTKHLEFIEEIYNSLIKKAANFLLSYRADSSHLPFSSYDLWEMRYSINTFTSASVYGGLSSAAKFAKTLGKENDEKLYGFGAKEIKEAILRNLYNEEKGYFYCSIEFKDGEAHYNSAVDSSSFYSIFHFGILPATEPRMKRAIDVIEKELYCNSSIGGYARFQDDRYYQEQKEFPGNPWIITTLWIAQYYIAVSERREDLKRAYELIMWAVDRALPSGILPEQVDPKTGEQLSATPLIWSHAEFVTTVLLYLEKLTEINKNGKK